MNLELLFSTSFLFLIILDPIGNIPIFVSALKGFEPKQQFTIIIRELLIALFILLLFFFFGRSFFTILNIDQASLQVAGSTTFFLIGVKMLFSQPKTTTTHTKHVQEEPFIVPLATPAVAGPGILATVMLYGGNANIPKLMVLLAILISWICLVPCLLAAPYIKKIFKENGLIAAERLFAYLVILIAVQMAISGLQGTFAQ